MSTHNKHYIFHQQACTRMYDVCFDIFRYLDDDQDSDRTTR